MTPLPTRALVVAALACLTLTAAAQSGPLAFGRAGIAAADVDVLQLYDSFTPTVLGDGLINLGVKPEVSQIDTSTERAVISNGFRIPATRFRWAAEVRPSDDLRNHALQVAGLGHLGEHGMVGHVAEPQQRPRRTVQPAPDRGGKVKHDAAASRRRRWPRVAERRGSSLSRGRECSSATRV